MSRRGCPTAGCTSGWGHMGDCSNYTPPADWVYTLAIGEVREEAELGELSEGEGEIYLCRGETQLRIDLDSGSRRRGNKLTDHRLPFLRDLVAAHNVCFRSGGGGRTPSMETGVPDPPTEPPFPPPVTRGSLGSNSGDEVLIVEKQRSRLNGMEEPTSFYACGPPRATWEEAHGDGMLLFRGGASTTRGEVLQVGILGGRLVISIGVDTLVGVLSHGPDWPAGAVVSDPDRFVESICRELEREDGDTGETPLYLFFDRLAGIAIEGSEHVHFEHTPGKED